jgi:hypothetical protein
MSDISVMPSVAEAIEEESINRETFEEGLLKLIKETEVNKKPPKDDPGIIHLEQIRMAHSVFQPRQFLDGSVGYSEEHIQKLVEAIFNEPSHTLDPITVWWSGEKWRVIDGAHRLIAYRRVKSKGKLKNPLIPVKVFIGNLYQAIEESIKLNSKDKLPMTKSDKANSAWRMTVLDKHSKKQIHMICKVGISTVSRMRNVLVKFKEKFHEKYFDEALSSTWENAQRFDQEEVTRDESWEDKLAKNWSRRLAREFGMKAASQPAAFAKAIEIYSSNLPINLAEYWGYKEFKDDEESDF